MRTIDISPDKLLSAEVAWELVLEASLRGIHPNDHWFKTVTDGWYEHCENLMPVIDGFEEKWRR